MSPVAKLVNTLIRPEILALNGYHVPDSSGLVKLDAMENPYLVPKSLREEIASVVACAHINRYPDPNPVNLKEKIRQATGLPDGMNVLLGNGSDELIQLLAMAVNKPGAVMLSVEPSFVMYRMISTFVSMRYVAVPLIFLAYPNNPTGNLFSRDELCEIINAAPGLVVVDEAYYAFASESFIPQLADYPNLLVMRTFSKLGMAGLRLGFLAGSTLWLEQLEKLRLPYNVGVLPQLVAEILLDNHSVLLQQADRIKMDRNALYRQLSEVGGVKAFSSEANFLLFRVANATEVFNGLKQHGVLIKNLNGAHPMLTDCLRVTVGTSEENELFLVALQACLKCNE
jgi:histidinol-phosphate aminotransferase